MDKRDAWNFAIGLCRGSGLVPTDDFKKMIEKEISGEITTADMKKYLDMKFNRNMKGGR